MASRTFTSDRALGVRRNRRGRALLSRFAAILFAALLVLCARSASAADLAILTNGFSIRHDHRATMGATTRLFFSVDDSSSMDVPTADITGFEKDLSIQLPAFVEAPASTPALVAPAKSAVATARGAKAPVLPLNQVVDSASATYHLDPDLVNSVIHAESGFNAHAVSPKGARGLMQLMPSTASKLGVNDAFDPQANVDGGSRYLRELLERYNFDIVKALAAYNAGPQRVEQYGGVPPYRETRAYVNRIVREYNRKKDAQEKEAKLKEKEARRKLAASKAATTVPSSPKNAAPKSAAAKPPVPTIAARVPQASPQSATSQR